MAVTIDDGLRALREAARLAQHVPADLDRDYLKAIAAVESLPANQPGVDKTWVWDAEDAFRRHYAQAVHHP